MSPAGGAARTQPCSIAQARTRLQHARKFLDVAERRRSRGQDHRQATDLVEQIANHGPQAASALRRLLSLKDEAHYGLFDVGGQDLQAALRQAKSLVDFADEVVRRSPA